MFFPINVPSFGPSFEIPIGLFKKCARRNLHIIEDSDIQFVKWTLAQSTYLIARVLLSLAKKATCRIMTVKGSLWKVFLAILAQCYAQTPPGFTPSCSMNLGVAYPGGMVVHPGDFFRASGTVVTD